MQAMQAILQAVTQFLKKHYEKIILCVVLLGLAAAAVWMGAVITRLKTEVSGGPSSASHHGKALLPLDLGTDMLALAQVTNPPPVILSGDHNLFNPVTWKKKGNGELLKILRSGPDALTIANIAPLYMIISYDHPTGTAGIYVFNVQTNSGRKMLEHPKLNEKPKSGLYMVVGTEGAAENPTSLHVKILDGPEQPVSISHDNPYKQVDGYTVDLKYAPDPDLRLNKKHVNDVINLDNEQYKIVEITSNAVRVQAIKNTKVTTVEWNGAAETGTPTASAAK